MRAVFAEHGQGVDYEKLRRHGIAEVVVPAHNSPLANTQSLIDLKNNGFHPAVGVSWDWYGPMEGHHFARKCDEILKSFGSTSPNPSLWADIEALDYLNQSNFADFVAAFCIEWRKLRVSRRTIWTLNPFQGACFNGKHGCVQTILNSKIEIVLQYYVTHEGDQMYPAAADVAKDELSLYGFPSNAIRGYYDAKRPPYKWDGGLWTSARLP